jgi:hypothetical protein
MAVSDFAFILRSDAADEKLVHQTLRVQLALTVHPVRGALA